MATVSYLPPDLRDYVEAQSNAEPAAKDWVVFAVGVCILIGYIITSVGLYRFRPWAKKLFLPLNIIALLLMPLHGPSVMTGWASAFNGLNFLVGGGVLFLVYLSPVSQMFVADGDI
ncbi:MAG TPA: hypothetical protein VIQ24_21935 [Pyrinomonadaceae bacterium]